jgi:hemolysin III
MSLRIPVGALVADYTETPAEERANVLSHVLGLAFSLAVAWPLMTRALPLGATVAWSIALFAGAQIFTYLSSTLYHGSPAGRARRIFLACDHIAIYLLIAGTWTPLILLTMDRWFHAAVLASIWGMAAVGTLLRLFRYSDVTGPILLLYLGCGWAGVVLLPHIWASASPLLALSVAAGGLLYTIGVAFYLWRSLPFNHLYWHLFSLAGSLVHFAGIWLLLTLLEA